MSRAIARIRYVKGFRSYFIGRKQVTLAEYNAYLTEVVNPPLLAIPRPQKSVAAGCHPSQVREAESHAAKVGVPTEYTDRGEAVFRDREHRKRFLKAHKMRDNQGSYGD